MDVKAGTPFYDSASKRAPAHALIAAYADGKYAYTAAQVAVHRGHFMISVYGDPAAARYARCLDIERYDATPSDAPAFVQARLNHGHHDALLYVNRGNEQAVVDACTREGLHLGIHYHLWVATLDGTWHLPDMTGVAAIQGYHDPQDRFDMSRTCMRMSFVKGHG